MRTSRLGVKGLVGFRKCRSSSAPWSLGPPSWGSPSEAGVEIAQLAAHSWRALVGAAAPAGRIPETAPGWERRGASLSGQQRNEIALQVAGDDPMAPPRPTSLNKPRRTSPSRSLKR